MIPFSVWRNNDLWNLLPTHPGVNQKKRDKIPTPEFIERRQELILKYWRLMNDKQSTRFMKEIQLSLLGYKTKDIEEKESPENADNWLHTGINQLKENCRYLINLRGFEEWKL
jgi:hypothetical protein